jgi:hypothetical protein
MEQTCCIIWSRIRQTGGGHRGDFVPCPCSYFRSAPKIRSIYSAWLLSRANNVTRLGTASTDNYSDHLASVNPPWSRKQLFTFNTFMQVGKYNEEIKGNIAVKRRLTYASEELMAQKTKPREKKIFKSP